ncbi:MAG: cation:proton antiporter, partial [Candidatus Aenigmarchaeota archaeon]|nr:cation:proton antiporter [Candidatus Aenigmarchaeota archaeon]
MSTLLFDLGIVIIAATAVAYGARLLKQPLLVAYVLAGVIIGPIGLGLITNFQEITTLAELGVAFLLFTVGLEIDFKKLKEVGKATLTGGVLQIIITFIVGLFLGNVLGFDFILSIYAGLLVAFSSTMIVTKILIDRNELQSLHGRIMIGILLIQDIAVILALPLLTNVGGVSFFFLGEIILKGLGLFAIAVLLNRFAFPRILDFAAGMREILFLTAVSVVFLFIGVSYFFGFSIAIGAFIAGIALGSFPYNLEIVGETRALMDFFSIIFFTSLGMSLNLAIISGMLIPFLVLLAAVLVLKPILLSIMYVFMGYGTRASSMVGVGLAQASEFSFIL